MIFVINTRHTGFPGKRGSRIENQGSRIDDRVKKNKKQKPNHEVPSAQDVEKGLIKINLLNEPKRA